MSATGISAAPGPAAHPIEESLALYVHMPWCVRKCPYCDFNSHQLKSAKPDAAYIDALICDFDSELPRVSDRRIDTVFFGGGTPSLFQPEDFHRLLKALRQRILFGDDVEITIEANPGTIERGRFAGYRDTGINRVSLGAQSFSPRALAALGRIHTADDTLRAVEELRDAGIENFNLDLMYGLPNQGPEEAFDDVRIACDLQPAHISYYQLTLEPGTVFHSRPPALPDEDAAWQIQCAGQKQLAAAGYVQYEVSAYARDGARCRHNLNYWTFGDYLGIGAGAHGKLSLQLPQRVLRTTRPKQPREYFDRLTGMKPGAASMKPGAASMKPGAASMKPVAPRAAMPFGEEKFIAVQDLPFEFMLNALRLNRGFSTIDYERRTGLLLACLEQKLLPAERQGLLERTPGGWRPTGQGHRFLNDLQAGFLP